MQNTTQSQPAANTHRWAQRLATTPPGVIRLNTAGGEVEMETGTLTPGQIAGIQLQQTTYGDTILRACHGDGALKDRRPGPFTLAWTDTIDGRVHAATWDVEGRPIAHGTSR